MSARAHGLVVEHVRRRAWPGRRDERPPLIGAEVELLPVDAVTRRVVDLHSRLLPFLRAHARSRAWTEQASVKGAPRFLLPRGGAVTFEPGGQVEFASRPFTGPRALIAELHDVVGGLSAAALAADIDLVSAGIDPFNAITAAPLQVPSARYRMMDAYFETIGPAGRRMMRQTASVQVNVDPAGDAAATWRMLNAGAPYLTAIFANSPVHAGALTGCASYRAETWRHLDPARTGILRCSGDTAAEYAAFALEAPVIFRKTPEGRHLPLRNWLHGHTDPQPLIDEHLSTLFPEVRAKGYFEVRSIDAIPPQWYAAPIILLAGMVMDADAMRLCADLLGAPEPEHLAIAGRVGLRDAQLRGRAGELVDIALAACARHGPGFVSPANLDAANDFFDRFTRRGSSPADESLRAARV